MTREEQKLLNTLKNGSPEFKQRVQKIFNNFYGGTQVPSFANTITGGAIDADDEYRKMMEARREILRAVGEAGQEAAAGQRLLQEASFELFGSIDAGIEATKALSSEMKTFAFMTSDVQKELGQATMVLNEFGVDMRTTGGILDTAAMAFGFSQEKLKGLASELATVVYKFPGQASEIARNFQSAQSSLAYDSDRLMRVFKKLQETSSTTGVSFDKLTNAFGESMDSFEGSATKAGSLNAILGRSVFNSIDLLGKTEAQRVDTIVRGVRQSIGGDVNRLGKFQLKAVAEGMGLTVEETRRLLSGQATPEDIMKGKEDPRKKLEEQAMSARKANTMGLEALTTEFKLYRSQLANLKIATAQGARQTILSTIREIPGLENVGTFSDSLEVVQNLLSGVSADIDPFSAQALEIRRSQMTGDVSEEQMIKSLSDDVKNTLTKVINKQPWLRNALPAGVLQKLGITAPTDDPVKPCPKGKVRKNGQCVNIEDPETSKPSVNSELVKAFKEGLQGVTLHISGLTGNTATAIVKSAKTRGG